MTLSFLRAQIMRRAESHLGHTPLDPLSFSGLRQWHKFAQGKTQSLLNLKSQRSPSESEIGPCLACILHLFD